MAPAELFVAMYRPHNHSNYAHWALCLQHGSENVILQLLGTFPDFKFEKRNGRAEDSIRLRRKIKIWDVNQLDVPALLKVASEHEIDTEVPSWDCQEWVIEVLEQLEEDAIIGYFEDDDDEDDIKDYKKTIRLVKNYRGPD